ncbi:MAG TPA: hypothetical protein VI818_00030 [Candidatus Thermoplasmatota archaeon]|nr:hypothetical protein [Candidatus Thermoplasmatota archaeon]
MRIILALACVGLIAWIPSTVAQGSSCGSIDVREQTKLGTTIRPEADEYRAQVVYIPTSCGNPIPIGPGCSSGSQVTFQLETPPTVRANVTPPRASVQGSQAQTTLRVSLNMTEAGAPRSLKVRASCAGSTAVKDVSFKAAKLLRVNAVVVRGGGDAETSSWRIQVTSTGNARAWVASEGLPEGNASNELAWQVPEPFPVRGIFDLPDDEFPVAKEVIVAVTGPNLSQPFSLRLRPQEQADSVSQEPFELPLDLTSFRGESPGPGLFVGLVGLLVAVWRRR